MTIKDVILTPPLRLIVGTVNAARVLVGFVCSLPFLALALIQGKKLGHVEELFATLNRAPLGRFVFDVLLAIKAPYTGSIDAHVESLELGAARVSMQERPWLHNPFNSIHAAALVNLGEMCTGLAIFPVLQHARRTRGIPVRLETQFVRKSRGRITATAKLDAAVPMVPGSHKVAVDCVMRDASNQVVATLTAHWQVEVQGDKRE